METLRHRAGRYLAVCLGVAVVAALVVGGIAGLATHSPTPPPGCEPMDECGRSLGPLAFVIVGTWTFGITFVAGLIFAATFLVEKRTSADD